MNKYRVREARLFIRLCAFLSTPTHLHILIFNFGPIFVRGDARLNKKKNSCFVLHSRTIVVSELLSSIAQGTSSSTYVC